MSPSDRILSAGRSLREELRGLTFSVPFVYDTFDYAWDGWRLYVEEWLDTPREALFLGMNPGPWGMAQTGVPFGEIEAVRHWLGLAPQIRRPDREHPKRPIEGMECGRSEVSGRRLWGLFIERYGTPKAFFARFAVVNYCPLVFMAESGRNITPDKLPKEEATPLFAACDRHLSAVLDALSPTTAIGVGRFAESALRRVLSDLGREAPSIRRILHPSPASPAANRDWKGAVERELSDLL